MMTNHVLDVFFLPSASKREAHWRYYSGVFLLESPTVSEEIRVWTCDFGMRFVFWPAGTSSLAVVLSCLPKSRLYTCT